MISEEFLKLRTNFLSKTRKTKYNNKKIEIDGQVFDSEAESSRAMELKQLEKERVIWNLEFQKVFKLVSFYTKKETKDRNLKIKDYSKQPQQITYKADFYYYDKRIEKYVVEDLKSEATCKDKTYILKRKLMLMHLKKYELVAETVFREYIVKNRDFPTIIDWQIK